MENISRGKEKSPSGEKESLRFKVYSFLQSGVQAERESAESVEFYGAESLKNLL